MIRHSSFWNEAAHVALAYKDYPYLIVWVDWPLESSTWRYCDHLNNCDAAKAEFFERIRTGRELTLEELTNIPVTNEFQKYK